MIEVYQSIFSTIEAFAYRCRNDEAYTMEFIDGAVEKLTGYPKAAIINNAKVSYASLMHEDDADAVVRAVDAAIAAKEPWDVDYRVKTQSGDLVHVRERGSAVFEKGQLVHLQGLVTGAEAEVELRTKLEQSLTKTHESTEEILKLTRNITGSLKQLNMLSINARIEAARSGEAGLGFAVVAEEIKSIADQNSNWATVISEALKRADQTLQ